MNEVKKVRDNNKLYKNTSIFYSYSLCRESSFREYLMKTIPMANFDKSIRVSLFSSRRPERERSNRAGERARRGFEHDPP